MTMTLIEGVGDEVTLFFVLLLLAVVACLAWVTTRVADRPLRIQTIIVGQRVIHVDDRGEPTAAEATVEREEPEPPGGAEGDPGCEDDEDGAHRVAVREEPSSEEGAVRGRTGEVAEPAPAPRDGREDGETPDPGRTAAEIVPADPVSAAADSSSTPSAGPISDPSPTETTSASRDPAPAPDPDPAAGDERQQLRRRRLAFMARQEAAPTAQTTSAPSDMASAQRTAPDSAASVETVRAAAADTAGQVTDTASGTADPTGGTTDTSGTTDTTGGTAGLVSGAADSADGTTADRAEGPAAMASESPQPQTITVKLKFLNDSQRLVEGRRAEPLADFKRRHFPTETAANRIVRLIFNGRVLPDQETLSQCGLYHNCVVHCHVSANPRPAAEGTPAENRAGGEPPELDIGMLLYPVLFSIVTLVWGLRLRYPELFSSTALLLMGVLTVLLAVFMGATLLPIEWHADRGEEARRQQQRGR